MLPSLSERRCRICGRSFIPRRPNQLDCSLGCRRDAKRRRNRRWWHRRAKPAPENPPPAS